MSVSLNTLVTYLDELMKSRDIKDYCPNGLQVEGVSDIEKVVTGVTASQALIDAAIEANAQAILVHHGYFWKGEPAVISGMKKKRISALLKNDISLIGYHLPVDVHPVMGNNAQLGSLIGFNDITALSGLKPTGIVMKGVLPEQTSAGALKQHLSTVLGRTVLHEGDNNVIVRTAAWCTGGGQSYIEQAVEAGVDAFITGEVSEQTIHIARECGIHFYAAGHHATERYGIKAVGEHLSSHFGIAVEFVDIDNPA